jgi:hypothetical protein
MLEPDDGKLSSPVLRGLAPSNGGRPLGVRAAAPCEVGTDRGGSLAGRGKGKGERGKGKGERGRKREEQSPRDLLWRAGPKLMKREPESMQKLWQTTTSTALFG